MMLGSKKVFHTNQTQYVILQASLQIHIFVWVVPQRGSLPQHHLYIFPNFTVIILKYHFIYYLSNNLLSCETCVSLRPDLNKNLSGINFSAYPESFYSTTAYYNKNRKETLKWQLLQSQPKILKLR